MVVIQVDLGHSHLLEVEAVEVRGPSSPNGRIQVVLVVDLELILLHGNWWIRKYTSRKSFTRKSWRIMVYLVELQ
jgi:hypothetical protein